MLRRENQFPGRWYRLESEIAEHYVGKNATGTDTSSSRLAHLPGPRHGGPVGSSPSTQAFERSGTSKGGEIRKTVGND